MRLIRFLDFLLFPDKYIHQVYVWEMFGESRDGVLHVDIVWRNVESTSSFPQEITLDIELSRFSWVKAAWVLSGRMK